ncbi:hypothetical protein LCM20_15295 [Halobacillus litoralis]|uniref:hypothetical protein n=1 Tax=Halobacillus litoralis TaxID=45668 RepID=UPI001CD636DC|nr:hypothetical protein [Halobacillus litoralis]MCA0971970.1 hypothetical protein [Halobacillus litoralis]
MKQLGSAAAALAVVLLCSLWFGRDEVKEYALNEDHLQNTVLKKGAQVYPLVPGFSCVREASCDLNGFFRMSEDRAEELGAPTIDVEQGDRVQFEFDTETPGSFTYSKIDLLALEGGRIEDPNEFEIEGARGTTMYYTFRATWENSAGLQTYVMYPVFFQIK